MVVKHCVYKDCKSDSRFWDREYMKGIKQLLYLNY